MGLYAACDLHSNNTVLGVLDEAEQVILKRRLPNELPVILETLEPYRRRIKGIVVESTFNWYWLVDGLADDGYKVHLANPSAIEQYDGLKHSDDESDAVYLARLLRLRILPEGYIYPREERPVRDLLRKRMKLVQERTSHLLSLQSLTARHLGKEISSNVLKKLRQGDGKKLFTEEHLILSADTNIEAMRFLTRKILLLERVVKKETELKPEYQCLLTVPGIGPILALTIALETGDISRFAGVGNYSSYCRLVKSDRMTNRKKKGEGNQKSGNRYLCWAYIEAANTMRRYCEPARKFHQRKLAKTKNVVATKALANKISKACYFMMRDKVGFDVNKIFK